YYTLAVPPLIRTASHLLSGSRRAELNRFTSACQNSPEFAGMVQHLFDHLLPRAQEKESASADSLEALLEVHGFDRVQHEQIRADLQNGRIGLAQNSLPVNSRIEDVVLGDYVPA